MDREDVFYPFEQIEKKWQKYWVDSNSFKAEFDPAKPKYYLLEMFPYPSGKIHMGHVRNYTIGDVAARYRRSKGFNVLHPMGFDAFGQPAENAAIKNKTKPDTWTHKCIEDMEVELKRMGLSYDWDREISTCDSNYYKWNQWIFLKMFERASRTRRARMSTGARHVRQRLQMKRSLTADAGDAIQRSNRRTWSNGFSRSRNIENAFLKTWVS